MGPKQKKVGPHTTTKTSIVWFSIMCTRMYKHPASTEIMYCSKPHSVEQGQLMDKRKQHINTGEASI